MLIGRGPQKLDQTNRLPELRERTPLLWATTGGYQNPCRTFAEVSNALLCTVMHFATDVTAKKQCKFKDLVPQNLATNQGVVGSSPAGRARIPPPNQAVNGPFR
jgi:hypothetical protein